MCLPKPLDVYRDFKSEACIEYYLYVIYHRRNYGPASRTGLEAKDWQRKLQVEAGVFPPGSRAERLFALRGYRQSLISPCICLIRGDICTIDGSVY